MTVIVLLLLATSCASRTQVPAGYARAQSATAVRPQPRKTSPPYTGDLSKFEAKDRAQKLQVERVMDILSIKPGRTVADIGAGSGWFTVRAARRIGDASKNKIFAVRSTPHTRHPTTKRSRLAGCRATQKAPQSRNLGCFRMLRSCSRGELMEFAES